jgi:hypothetical protein
MRAPIFYDSDDTNYFIDPSGGQLRFESTNWTGEFAGKIQYHGEHWYLQAADSGGWVFRNASASNLFNFSNGGHGNATGSWRGPIFYDSNDTGYYVDPAGASNIATLNVQSINASVGVKSPNQRTQVGCW